ncbi:MAG: hypothetical protein ACRENP_05675 [Longimicrobiales bacterium]
MIPHDSGGARTVYAPTADSADPRAVKVVVSEDSRTLFFKSHDVQGRAALWSVPVTGGRPRLLVTFNDLAQPSIRPDFAAGAGRLFFTIDDRQSDIWVAEVTRK